MSDGFGTCGFQQSDDSLVCTKHPIRWKDGVLKQDIADKELCCKDSQEVVPGTDPLAGAYYCPQT